MFYNWPLRIGKLRNRNPFLRPLRVQCSCGASDVSAAFGLVIPKKLKEKLTDLRNVYFFRKCGEIGVSGGGGNG
jgi:hypothetical protein